MNFSIVEELQLILLKEYELKKVIMLIYDYWNPTLGEFLKVRLKPENEFSKFAVAVKKCDVVVGHLSKGKTGRFTKTISFSSWKQIKSLAKLKLLGKE